MVSKTALARSLGVARSSLCYISKKERRDWELKGKIETVLRAHPSYGSRRIAQELCRNRKGVRRAMRRFGVRPYRRRGRKWRKQKKIQVVYPNLVQMVIPASPHHVWAADFTEIRFQGRSVYIATVIDLYTREITGVAVSLRKGALLTLQALWAAFMRHPASGHLPFRQRERVRCEGVCWGSCAIRRQCLPDASWMSMREWMPGILLR